MRDELTVDQYAPLSHKLPLARDSRTFAPTWVGQTERRRLDAYTVLAAYQANVARCLLPASSDDLDEHREYGDPALLVGRVVDGILGDDFQIVVAGADDELPDIPDLPDHPDDPGDDALPHEQRIHQARLARWQATVDTIIDTWEQAWTDQPALQARQQQLREWADLEFLAGKLAEGESDTVGLGDSVYVLAWDAALGQPTLAVYDPGFYFPVLDSARHGYPTKIHLAWEEDLDGDGTEDHLRRLTFELGPILPTIGDDGDIVYNTDGQVMLGEGDRWDRDGRIVRTYPWTDEPSDQTCYFTDARWELAHLRTGHGVGDLNPERAIYQPTSDGQIARDLDLRIDFLPVVHVPNTPSTREHFGTSIVTMIAQLLDSLQASDTDIEAASALAAGPAIALAGGNLADQVIVGPGAVYQLAADGRMDVLDLSAGLATLMANGDRLLERVATNSRIPAEVLGRGTAGGQAESGFSRLLKLGPFRQLIKSLRRVRQPKYQLMLKMAQRLYQAGGVWEPGQNPEAAIAFGSYLPADLAGVVDQVVRLLAEHGISRRTALRMLVDVGLDIDDIVTELDRIAAEDTEGAVHVADATGSEELAADRLGLELPERPAVAPPTVGTPTAFDEDEDEG